MSAVADIEEAIQKLPTAELCELVAWLEDYQAALGASESLFAMYDAEEEQAHAQSQAG